MRKTRVKMIDGLVRHLAPMEYNVDFHGEANYRQLSHQRRARRRYIKAGKGHAGFLAVLDYIYESEMRIYHLSNSGRSLISGLSKRFSLFKLYRLMKKIA